MNVDMLLILLCYNQYKWFSLENVYFAEAFVVRIFFLHFLYQVLYNGVVGCLKIQKVNWFHTTYSLLIWAIHLSLPGCEYPESPKSVAFGSKQLTLFKSWRRTKSFEVDSNQFYSPVVNYGFRLKLKMESVQILFLQKLIFFLYRLRLHISGYWHETIYLPQSQLHHGCKHNWKKQNQWANNFFCIFHFCPNFHEIMETHFSYDYFKRMPIEFPLQLQKQNHKLYLKFQFFWIKLPPCNVQPLTYQWNWNYHLSQWNAQSDLHYHIAYHLVETVRNFLIFRDLHPAQ